MQHRKLALVGILFLASCLVAFWIGTRQGRVEGDAASEPEATTWYCSMDPHITLPYKGKCSICGMDLIPLRGGVVDAGPRSVKMTSTAIALAGIETVKVERKSVDLRIRMSGKIDFDETKVKTVTAWVPGRLERLYVDYAGVPVSKGDHLADIYSPKLYEAQKQLLEALKTVEESAVVSERSRLSLEAVRKRLQLLGLSAEQITAIEDRKTLEEHMLMNSTVAGVVIEKLANVGDYVETGAPLYKVVSLDHLWVKLDAYESDLPWLRYGQKVSFQTEAYPGEEFEGSVTFIDWVVDDRTRTTKVRLIVKNEGGRLKPGMFVRAEAYSSFENAGTAMDPSLAGKWISPMHPEIVKSEPGLCDVCGMDLVPAEEFFRVNEKHKHVMLGHVGDAEEKKPAKRPASPGVPLVIPTSAALLTGPRAVVYVKSSKAEGVFEGRDVVLGPRAGDYYVVLEGLEEGDEVVVRGNFKIDSALQIVAKPSMMNPDKSKPTEKIEKLAVPEGFAAPLEALFSAYLELSRQLVATDFAKSKAAHEVVAKAWGGLSEPAAKTLDDKTRAVWGTSTKSLDAAIRSASVAKDVEELRKHFGEISRVMIDVARRFDRGDAPALYEAYCPMAFNDAGAAWIQADKAVLNPYFGDRMLRCGVVRGELGK